MNVRELIEILQQCDPEALVMVQGDYEEECHLAQDTLDVICDVSNENDIFFWDSQDELDHMKDQYESLDDFYHDFGIPTPGILIY